MSTKAHPIVPILAIFWTGDTVPLNEGHTVTVALATQRLQILANTILDIDHTGPLQKIGHKGAEMLAIQELLVSAAETL